MATVLKLTEDETILLLINHLSITGWNVESHCLGQEKGCDIVASQNGSKLYIEVKGARASDTAPTKKRDFFDRGQIKKHFGVAIVKILEDRYTYPDSSFAIAHPDDLKIRESIGHLIPALKGMGIRHFWVSPGGTVIED